jgi:two-component system LytT family response regulator
MAKFLRCFIVDDEAVARMELRDHLAEIKGVRLVGEAGSLREAASRLAGTEADVLLLDVELEDGTGFDLLEELDARLAVIFITHHMDFAFRAFEVAAVDYLRKPVTHSRLLRALERCEVKESPNGEDAVSEETLLTPDSLVCLADGSRRYFLRPREIVYLRADQKYTRVYRKGRRDILCREPLRSWEGRLPEGLFRRVHRSLIVNLEAVDFVESRADGSGSLHFKESEEVLPLPRSAMERFREGASFSS